MQLTHTVQVRRFCTGCVHSLVREIEVHVDCQEKTAVDTASYSACTSDCRMLLLMQSPEIPTSGHACISNKIEITMMSKFDVRHDVPLFSLQIQGYGMSRCTSLTKTLRHIYDYHIQFLLCLLSLTPFKFFSQRENGSIIITTEQEWNANDGKTFKSLRSHQQFVLGTAKRNNNSNRQKLK